MYQNARAIPRVDLGAFTHAATAIKVGDFKKSKKSQKNKNFAIFLVFFRNFFAVFDDLRVRVVSGTGLEVPLTLKNHHFWSFLTIFDPFLTIFGQKLLIRAWGRPLVVSGQKWVENGEKW